MKDGKNELYIFVSKAAKVFDDMASKNRFSPGTILVGNFLKKATGKAD
mgnify:FL=1